MDKNGLLFNLENCIEVNSRRYIVKGSILFSDKANNSKWTEYKLKSSDNGEIKWLSIDLDYNEYALYSELPFYDEFKEDNIKNSGYTEVDSGKAVVSEYSGDVDVSYGDIVTYKEFEDLSQENIISIEDWEDEREYSKGYYVEAENIRNLNSGDFSNSNYEYKDSCKKKIKIAYASILAISLAVLGIGFLLKATNKNLISNFLASNSNFQYNTSITSDLDTTQKADVYTTSLSIEDAVKSILNEIGRKSVEVQENKEDASVGLLTDSEYCFIYTGNDSNIFVQISSRLFAYSSNTSLYHSHASTSNYYRAYYYSQAYSNDKITYRKNMNAYNNYSGNFINIDPNDKYKSYSSTIRQSSVSSRSSSGGGISFGK